MPQTVRRKSVVRPSTSASKTRPKSKRARTVAGDWRVRTLARVRALIREADPDVVEEVKWRKASNDMQGVPVWSHGGILCTGETYKDKVKLTFAKGAGLPDPAGLFNAKDTGMTRRAIDLRESDVLDARAFKELVRAAVDLNGESSSNKKAPAKKARGKPRLLSGGNPQIAKADGDAPVQAYIAAVPGWKRDVARRLDELITQNAPGVRKAVKWNSPFYGMEGQGWFASFHVFANYVKLTFFRGTSLRPAPPGGKSKEARWVDVHEDDLDERQVVSWVKQAAAIPGWGG